MTFSEEPPIPRLHRGAQPVRYARPTAMPQNGHSEKRNDEESGAGLPQVSVNPPPQTPSEARGDTSRASIRQGRPTGEVVSRKAFFEEIGRGKGGLPGNSPALLGGHPPSSSVAPPGMLELG
jgi:hypothetical protein